MNAMHSDYPAAVQYFLLLYHIKSQKSILININLQVYYIYDIIIKSKYGCWIFSAEIW